MTKARAFLWSVRKICDKVTWWPGHAAQVPECWPSIHEVLVQSPALHESEPGCELLYNLSALEVEAADKEFKVILGLHSKLRPVWYPRDPFLEENKSEQNQKSGKYPKEAKLCERMEKWGRQCRYQRRCTGSTKPGAALSATVGTLLCN